MKSSNKSFPLGRCLSLWRASLCPFLFIPPLAWFEPVGFFSSSSFLFDVQVTAVRRNNSFYICAWAALRWWMMKIKTIPHCFFWERKEFWDTPLFLFVLFLLCVLPPYCTAPFQILKKIAQWSRFLHARVCFSLLSQLLWCHHLSIPSTYKSLSLFLSVWKSNTYCARWSISISFSLSLSDQYSICCVPRLIYILIIITRLLLLYKYI